MSGMRAEGFLGRLSAIGAAAQASVPGAYAWGVTVVPCAWAHGTISGPSGGGAVVVARVAAAAALVALAAGVAGERRWGLRARVPSLWGFILSSATVWVVAPAGLGALRLDAPRGLAGMLGWGLYAMASAAPAMPALLRDPDDDPPDGQAAEASEGAAVLAPPPRERVVRGDWVYLVAAGVGAAALQSAGWRVGAPERGLLVRLVALAAGLALVGAAAQIALARHASRRALSRSGRLRRSMVSVVVLALLGASGLLFWLRS